MNKLITVLMTFLLILSYQVKAEFNNQGRYIGVSYIASSNLDILSIDEQIGPGYGINVGYDYFLNRRVTLAMDLEYSYYGKYEENIAYSEMGATLTSWAISVNPKFYIASSNFYLGGTIGLGRYSLSINEYDFQISKASITGDGLVLGLAAGYEFRNFGFDFGYKFSNVDFDDVYAKTDSFYTGVKYYF